MGGEMEAVKAAAASASAEIESLQDDETVRQLTSEISSTGSGDAMSASGSAEAATGSGDATSASGSAEAERVERDLETVMSTGSTGSGTLGPTGEEGEGSSASSSSFVEIQEREELVQEMKTEVEDEEAAMGVTGATGSSSGSTGSTGGTGGHGQFELPLGDQRASKRILMAARAKKAAKQAAEAVVKVKQAGGTAEDIAKVSGFANRAMNNAKEAVIQSQEEINHMETSTKIERATEKERKEEAKKAADKAMQKVKEEANKAAKKLKAEEEARKALEAKHKSEMHEKEMMRQQEEKKKREEIAAVKAAEQKEKSDRVKEAEENKKELKKLRKQLADNEKKEEKREKEDIRAKKAEAKRHAAELLKAAASAKRKEIMEEEHEKEMERAREAARSAREKQAEEAEKDRTSTLERVNEEAKKERARAFEEGEAAEQKRARERAIARLEANTKQAKEKLIADAEVAEQNALAKSKTTLGPLGIGAGLDGNSLLNANAAAHQAAQTKIQADHATALSIIHADNADALVKLVKMKDTFVKQEKEKIEKYEHDIVKDSLAREIAAREKLAREKSQLKNLMSFDDDDDDDDGVGKPSGTSGNTGSADAIETARTEGSRSRNGVGSAGGARVTKASTEAMQKAIMDKERKEVTDAEIEQAMRVAAELARARAEKKAAILQARRANMRLIDAVKKSVEAKDDLADAQQRLKDLTFSYGQVKASQSHGADQLKTDKALIEDAQERVELATAAVRESTAAAEAAGTADKNAQNRVAAARELLALAEESAEREEKRLKSAIMTTGTGMTGPSSALAHGLALAKELTGPTGNDGRKRTLADLALDTSETAASGSTGITGASGAGDTFVGEDAREKLALEALGVEKGAHRPRDAADALAVFNVGQTPTGGASPNRTEGVLTKTTVEKRTMGVLVSDESATGHPGEVLIKPLPAGRGFPGMNQIGPEVEQEVLDQMAKEREDDEDIKLLTKATESARKDAENAKNAAIALAAQKAKAENAVEESNVALDNALVGGANETEKSDAQSQALASQNVLDSVNTKEFDSEDAAMTASHALAKLRSVLAARKGDIPTMAKNPVPKAVHNRPVIEEGSTGATGPMGVAMTGHTICAQLQVRGAGMDGVNGIYKRALSSVGDLPIFRDTQGRAFVIAACENKDGELSWFLSDTTTGRCTGQATSGVSQHNDYYVAPVNHQAPAKVPADGWELADQGSGVGFPSIQCLRHSKVSVVKESGSELIRDMSSFSTAECVAMASYTGGMCPESEGCRLVEGNCVSVDDAQRIQEAKDAAAKAKAMKEQRDADRHALYLTRSTSPVNALYPGYTDHEHGMGHEHLDVLTGTITGSSGASGASGATGADQASVTGAGGSGEEMDKVEATGPEFWAGTGVSAGRTYTRDPMNKVAKVEVLTYNGGDDHKAGSVAATGPAQYVASKLDAANGEPLSTVGKRLDGVPLAVTQDEKTRLQTSTDK